MRKKSILMFVLIASILFSSVLFAQDVTVKFMNFSSSDANAKYLEEMKNIFEEENPGIKIEVETIGFGDYFTKLMTVIAGGNPPDAFELNYENFYTYAKKGVLMDLGNLMKNTNFDSSVINEMALNAFKADNKQFGLPFSFSNVLLIYNKDLFDKAGVEYPNSDWTWVEEQAAAEKIRALGRNTFGIFHPVHFWEFYKVVRQNGGNLFNKDRTAFTVNSSQNIETLQFMVDRILKTNVMPNDAQLAGMGDWDLFVSGRIGMIVTGTWAFPTFTSDAEFEWDVEIEPGMKDKATHFFSNGLVLSKKAKNTEAAFKWIEFLSSNKKVAKIRIDAAWELPAVTYEDILADYVSQTPPNNKEAVFESLDYLVTPPVIEQFAEMADIMNRYLEAARYGDMTPKEALDKAQEELSSKINL